MFSPCNTSESDIGMRYYLSGSESTLGRLKAKAEDFVVEEISSKPPEHDDGKFTIVTVTSKNWETNRMVRLMSRQLGISRDRIGFAGTKDKRAVTTQLMSFMCPKERLSQVKLNDLEFNDIYSQRRGIRLGDLIGNRFTIRVSEVEKTKSEIDSVIQSVTSELKAAGGFPNYFGVQRFGSVRPITHLVGEQIVRGNPEEAVKIYVCYPSKNPDGKLTESDEVRKQLSETDDWSSFVGNLPDIMGFEAAMVQHMVDNPGDWNGAIEKMPTNLQMMFVHAYQSYLFNLMLSERISRSLPLNLPVEGDVVIPQDADGNPDHENPVLVTQKNIDLVERQVKMKRAFVTHVLYGSDGILAEGVPGEIEHSVIESVGIDQNDFVIPELPHCSSTGTRREILCPLGYVNCSIGSREYTLSFDLPKGNYATCLLREYMKSDVLDY